VPTPRPGDNLTSGLLYRRIPNWQGWWDPVCGLPLKQAFNPGRDQRGNKETGISTFLVQFTNLDEVLDGHDPAFGVVLIDIAELLHTVETNVRPRMGGKKGVQPFGEFSIKFDPDHGEGAAKHAHCWIDPVPPAVQKEIVRLTSPARVRKPCGLLRSE